MTSANRPGSSPGLLSRLGGRRTTIVLVLLAAAAFCALGFSWAYSSPPGSAADDDYHLSSIWCAWGDQESCVLNPAHKEALVPDRIANSDCYALVSGNDARCTWLLTDKLVSTARINGDSNHNPQLFYMALRAFVGPDAARSVVIMRFANVALAALLFSIALMISRPVIRRALLLGWAAALIPVGIYFISSTNPTSWGIAGLGVYWAFLYTFLSEHSFRSRRALAAVAGAVVAVVLCLGSRSDTVYPLALSTIGVAVMTYPKWKARARSHWAISAGALGALILVGLITWKSRAGSLVGLVTQLQFPAGDAARDQPNAIVKTLLELPSHVAAMFGAQAPTWSQRSSNLDGGTPGYSWPGFTYGLGWTDVAMPSLVGVIGLAVAAALFIVGLGSYSRRKLFALLLMGVGFVAEVLYVRALFGFQVESVQLQPRYLFPLILVSLCIALIAFPAGRRLLNQGQTVVFIVALTVANSVALRATIARYVHGQDHSYTQLSDLPRWWWPTGPSPDALWLMGSVAGLAWFVLVFALVRSAEAEARRAAAKPLRLNTLPA